MKKIIGVLFLFTIFNLVISCGNSPEKFNDELITIVTSAEKEYGEFGLEVNSANASNLDKLPDSVKKGVGKMNKHIDDINAIEIPSDGEELKEACLAYIETMKNSMGAFIKQEGKLSKEELTIALGKVEDNEKILDEQDASIMNAQKKFADKKGIPLEETEAK